MSLGRWTEPEDDTSLHTEPPEVVFRDSLLPAIKNRSVESVRALLESLSRNALAESVESKPKRAATTCGTASEGACTGQCGDETCDIGRARVRDFVNLLCPDSGQSALYMALRRENYEIGRELLKHGADPEYGFESGEEASRRRPVVGATDASEHRQVSCLDIVVRDGSLEMAEVLIKAGAKVTLMTWNSWLIHRRTRSVDPFLMFRILLAAAGELVPITVLFEALAWAVRGDDDVEELKQLLRSVNWIHGKSAFESNHFVMDHAVRQYPDSRFLLQMPAHGLVQQFYKSLFLQTILVHMCDSYDNTPDEESLVSILVAEGASVDGWTYGHTRVMERAWCNKRLPCEVSQKKNPDPEELQKTIYSHVSFWVRFTPAEQSCKFSCSECGTANLERCGFRKRAGRKTPAQYLFGWEKTAGHLPDHMVHAFHPACLMPAVLCFVCRSSEVMREAILSHSQAAWYIDPQSLPIATHQGEYEPRLILHDGPTCGRHASLSEEQKKVSLMMCTCSGGKMQSLMSLCRDVVTTSCLEHMEDVFTAVESLPLPPRLKSYMLSN